MDILKVDIIVSNSSHLVYLPQISKLIQHEADKSNMCSQDDSDLIKHIINSDSLLVFHEKKLIGYTHLEEYIHYVEICSSVIKHKFRNKGAGTKLTQECINLALSKYSNKELVIFSHHTSEHISRKLGFIEKNKTELETELVYLCEQCLEVKDFPHCRCIIMVYPR